MLNISILKKIFFALIVCVTALVVCYQIGWVDDVFNYLHQQKIETEIKKQGWHKTKTPLWQDKQGNLALKVKYRTSDDGDFQPRFITYFGIEPNAHPLKDTIDLDTFEQLNASFYQDKNNIYVHYSMIDGGIFYIAEVADKSSFRVLNSCFARDDKAIYQHRFHDTSMYDVATFNTCDTCGCLAKDKTGYYYFEEKINPDDFLNDKQIDTETKSNLKKLIAME